MTKEELLTEIDDLLRTMPPMATFHDDTEENLSWLGRLTAILNQWNSPHMVYVKLALHDPQVTGLATMLR